MDSQLSIKEKRRVVLSTLLRHSDEASIFRNRYIDRITLCGLIGSNKDAPFQIKEILQNVKLDQTKFSIRPEVIKDSLNRLSTKGFISETRNKKRNCYYLSEAGTVEVENEIPKTEDGFKKAADKLLKNSGLTVSGSEATRALRSLIL